MINFYCQLLLPYCIYNQSLAIAMDPNNQSSNQSLVFPF